MSERWSFVWESKRRKGSGSGNGSGCGGGNGGDGDGGGGSPLLLVVQERVQHSPKTHSYFSTIVISMPVSITMLPTCVSSY